MTLLYVYAMDNWHFHIHTLFHNMDFHVWIRSPTKFLHKKCTCTPKHQPPSDGNIYKHMSHATFPTSTFLGRGGRSHDLWTDTHVCMHVCNISCWSPPKGMTYRQNQKGEEKLRIGYQGLFLEGKTAILWNWSLFSVQCQGAWRQTTSFFPCSFMTQCLLMHRQTSPFQW
jgi:hypothetical protein